jgi:hypothetical protein
MAVIHPVVDEGLGNSAYVVELGDGRALVVDPARDPTPYLELARWRRLRIAYAIETHLHADFLTGSRDADARCRLGFLGNDDPHGDIDHDARAPQHGQHHKQHPQQGRVHVEVLGQATTHPGQLPVGSAAVELADISHGAAPSRWTPALQAGRDSSGSIPRRRPSPCMLSPRSRHVATGRASLPGRARPGGMTLTVVDAAWYPWRIDSYRCKEPSMPRVPGGRR